MRGLVILLLILPASQLFAQPPVARDEALLDSLVWGAYESIDPSDYPDDITSEVADYVKRVRQSCPPITFRSSGDAVMVRTGQLRSACRLAALSEARDAPQLARGYAIGLQPCAEWEGLHDCPEREARFADEYYLVHLDGPFRAFLPLLAAHRWLCAAEGYDRERRPAEAYLSRRWYEQRLGTALRSDSQLVRAAATTLSVRAHCFAGR